MERILLVEPNYKNKYPPIGLMKISTYLKNKGFYVEFHKGLLPCAEVKTFDKVMITTLFTFDFEMCIQTIRYYIAIVGIENVIVGGIAATILQEKFRASIPNLRLITRQLTSSVALGYGDDVNIDLLELDYDMLWDISYDYPAADSYFIYTTRGCPRECGFCAVKILEPKFEECENIRYQVESVNSRFGIKRQLLIMDNNILYSKNFTNTVETLLDLGFGKSNNVIQMNSNMTYYLRSLEDRIAIGKQYTHLLNRIKKEFIGLQFRRISKEDTAILKDIIKIINESDNETIVSLILQERVYITDFFKRYNYHKITRYVDFNQGLDARLFTEEKAIEMAKLAVKPCRIAFDHLSTKDKYIDAVELAIKHGIKHFSNYLLFNYKEKPEDLWKRLYINIELAEKHKCVSLFSFPMKYASIKHTNREYVGRYWNKKYLRAINVILNVTSGVVAKEKDFFLRAYGSTESEFLEILTMPDDFIRYRDFFERNGLIKLWKNEYRCLTDEEREILLQILSEMVEDPRVLDKSYCQRISDILFYYKIRKTKIETSAPFYQRLAEKKAKEHGIYLSTDKAV